MSNVQGVHYPSMSDIQLDRTNHGMQTINELGNFAGAVKNHFDIRRVQQSVAELSKRVFDENQPPPSSKEISDMLISVPTHLRPKVIEDFEAIKGLTNAQRDDALAISKQVYDVTGAMLMSLKDAPPEARKMRLNTDLANLEKQYGKRFADLARKIIGDDFSPKGLANKLAEVSLMANNTEVSRSVASVFTAQKLRQIFPPETEPSTLDRVLRNYSRLSAGGTPNRQAVITAFLAEGIEPSEAILESLGLLDSEGGDFILSDGAAQRATAGEGSEGKRILNGSGEVAAPGARAQAGAAPNPELASQKGLRAEQEVGHRVNLNARNPYISDDVEAQQKAARERPMLDNFQKAIFGMIEKAVEGSSDGGKENARNPYVSDDMAAQQKDSRERMAERVEGSYDRAKAQGEGNRGQERDTSPAPTGETRATESLSAGWDGLKSLLSAKFGEGPPANVVQVRVIDSNFEQLGGDMNNEETIQKLTRIMKDMGLTENQMYAQFSRLSDMQKEREGRK